MTHVKTLTSFDPNRSLPVRHALNPSANILNNAAPEPVKSPGISAFCTLLRGFCTIGQHGNSYFRHMPLPLIISRKKHRGGNH